MKIILYTFYLLCAASFAWSAPAQPEFYKDDFLNQHEINVSGGIRCQAVQIHKNWFLTAAHCVSSACGKECGVAITLMDGKINATAYVTHKSVYPTVFIYPGYSYGLNTSSNQDIALIRIPPDSHEMIYIDRLSQLQLTQEQFEKRLRDDSELRAQWSQFTNPPRARLLTFTGRSAKLNRRVAVPKLQGERILYYTSVGPVYYAEELGHLITLNFGVEPGMSGSGVITSDRDLVGVVSSRVLAADPDGTAKFYNADGEVTAEIANANDYFLFTGFNGFTMNFIRSTLSKYGAMRDIGVIPAVGAAAAPTKEKFDDILDLIRSAKQR